MLIVSLHAFDTDAVSAWTRSADLGLVIPTQDQGVAVCPGQVLGKSSRLRNVVPVK